MSSVDGIEMDATATTQPNELKASEEPQSLQMVQEPACRAASAGTAVVAAASWPDSTATRCAAVAAFTELQALAEHRRHALQA